MYEELLAEIRDARLHAAVEPGISNDAAGTTRLWLRESTLNTIETALAAAASVEASLLRVENARLKRSLELQERETRKAREGEAAADVKLTALRADVSRACAALRPDSLVREALNAALEASK